MYTRPRTPTQHQHAYFTEWKNVAHRLFARQLRGRLVSYFPFFYADLSSSNPDNNEAGAPCAIAGGSRDFGLRATNWRIKYRRHRPCLNPEDFLAWWFGGLYISPIYAHQCIKPVLCFIAEPYFDLSVMFKRPSSGKMQHHILSFIPLRYILFNSPSMH